MIDSETELFSEIKNLVLETYPNATVLNAVIPIPETSPVVTFVEIDSFIYQRGIDSSSLPKYEEVTYEVNVYSAKRGGAKAECKNILALIDDYLSARNIYRYSKTPAQLHDATMYRYVARYRAVVASNNEFYRR